MRKAKSKTAAGRVNKSAWIRSQPLSLSAVDLVAKAKKEGIKLSAAQVYTARSTAKRKPDVVVAPARGSAAPTRKASGSSLEAQFRTLALRIGTEHAGNLLDWLVEQGTPASAR
jgi:hypothetical protein